MNSVWGMLNLIDQLNMEELPRRQLDIGVWTPREKFMLRVVFIGN